MTEPDPALVAAVSLAIAGELAVLLTDNPGEPVGMRHVALNSTLAAIAAVRAHDKDDPRSAKPDNRTTVRAKLVASILTDHGQHVRSPDDGDLDDVELERWNVCVEIVRGLDEAP